ncbi:hypothetical protein D3C72_1863410 [compost metagenome]
MPACRSAVQSQEPASGWGVVLFSLNRCRVARAFRLPCGDKAAPATPASASAWRTRAAATRRLGCSASAACTSWFSCASPKVSHHDCAGQAAGVTAAPSSDSLAASALALPIRDCVCSPSVLAQPASSSAANIRLKPPIGRAGCLTCRNGACMVVPIFMPRLYMPRQINN